MMKAKLIALINILLLALLPACDREDDLYSMGNTSGPKLKDIIAFQELSVISLDADSASGCHIKVKINPEASAGKRTVTFVARSGAFPNNDTIQVVKANDEGIATTTLVSKQPGKCMIKAITDIYTIDTFIMVNAALPDDILLTSDPYTGDTSTSFSISAELVRNPGRGTVTDPVKVFFVITPLDTSINLIYPSFSFSSTHLATINITNPYKVSGKFKVVSKVLSSQGDTLKRDVMLHINK
ncbi:hypothetical protein FHW36_102655 [Chitinophaga polysaccharea]|uniref:Uncharacterized protein n=1 Tax=Chitinophaga polysaccharea TaxID=1293035 RepID=A0A561PXP3_9BACT|nr:hypothetical protein [Chitinophaga polysaccharea]TWF42894.1 hypothetical protein FHW36_102655 [Chitinophaga polysaccharea]